jgi:hypothetical protein
MDAEAACTVIWPGLDLKSADLTPVVYFGVRKKIEKFEEILSSLGK